ncbi:MAG: molybdopterin-guanine dinucleotide biosynthesis protein B [Coriobacteriales bacterium]|nr:molybdopterin-guanine dinucleotide biosynthesis protein B [Coriobacteriales bacterium]
MGEVVSTGSAGSGADDVVACTAKDPRSAAKSDTMVPAVAFVGKQNSGKTTLLEKVIAELVARGLNVGTLKHHSHVGFDMDIEGKDSWRHRKAGSTFTAVASPDQLGIVRALDRELDPEEVLAAMGALDAQGAGKLDIILVEGYRQSGLPTIELFRSGNPKDADRPVGGEGNRIVAVVTDIPRVVGEAQAQDISVFSFESISQLALFIEREILAIIP